MTSEPAVEIRSATAADEAALVALDAATWSAEVSPAPVPGPDARFFDGRREPDDVLVACLDGRVVGYLMLQQALGLPSHRHVLQVNGLAVDPAAQGRGVGRRLVESAQQEARRRGARKLTLRVLGSNPSARRLYQACGFVVEGVLREEFLLEGRYVDDVLMAWSR